MNQIIIYPNDDGHLSFHYPAKECGLTIDQIARKDVPAGKPYLIIPDEQVPRDHTFFSAFEADFSSPDGHGIGSHAWFIEQYEAEIAEINAETGPAAPQRLVAATNEQNAVAYAEAVDQWEASKAARIAQLNTQIATQQAEMAA